MSPRRQATADRSWFRPRHAAGVDEQAGPAGPDEQADRGARALPLGAPTPAAADPGTSPHVAPAAGTEPAAGTAPAASTAPAAGTAPAPSTESAGNVANAAGRKTAADVANQVPTSPAPDGPTVTRPAPWAHFVGPRRGTARTRAAQADLAARGSAIVPPEVPATEPEWRQPAGHVLVSGQNQEEAQSAQAQSAQAQSAQAQSAQAQSAQAQSAQAQSAQAQPAQPGSGLAGPGLAGSGLAEPASAVELPVEPRAAEPEIGESRAVESRAVESRAVESRAVESRAVESRAVESRAVELPAVELPAELRAAEPEIVEPAVGPPPEPVVSPGELTSLARQAGADTVLDRPASLSARLMALARMIQIGSARSCRDGFGPRLLADAEEVLARAGERMRLSSGHTVVVLAGGTGSGKSSLFNRLAGAELSTVGVTRPVTKDAHACVWGEHGSGAILEWLQVPGRYRYSRASALDSGEEDLAGLVLLDLPDHDSVMSHAGELVGRLVGMADVMVWVLDPQKYADAAVHRRFLVPMAGHSAVVAVVLNQVDLLDPAQVDDCVADLRRLLDSENLHDVPIVVASAATGAGLDDLRALLGRGVAARRAAAARISADLDGVVGRFLPFAGDVETGQAAPAEDGVPARTLADNLVAGRAATGSSAPGFEGGAARRGASAAPAAGEVLAYVPASAKSRLAERFAAAAGVTAISEALRSARELRAVDFVGWPVAWFVQRVTGRDPARKARIGALWQDLRAVTAGPAGAQQAEIDNALTELGSELAGPLPKPWSATIRSAVRSRAEEIPAAVGTAIGEALPAEEHVVWWWRLAGLWQGLLLGAAAVAVAWSALIAVVRTVHAQASIPGLMSDLAAVPWLVAAAIVALALGAATTWLCMKVVVTTAERENTQVTAELRKRIAAVAQAMVVAEAQQELAEFLRYREEARIAASGMPPAPGA